MNLPRPLRLSKFNKPFLLKILWSEFLFLGILTFCFSQDSTTFSEELRKAGVTESEKREKKYYNNLRSLQLKYQAHLDSSCNAKAELYRNMGAHFYNNDDELTALSYYQDTALQVALSCPGIDQELITQIYLNILGAKIILNQKESILPIIEKLKWHLQENKAGSLSHRAKIQNQISRYYAEVGDYDKSIVWIKSSLANHNKLPLSEKKLRAYLEWAYSLVGIKDYQKAIVLFDSIRTLAQGLNLQDDPVYHEALIYNKAVCYEYLGQYEDALYFNQVYASMTDPSDLIVRSDIANLKAYISYGEKKYAQALEHLQESIRLSIESKDEYQLLGLVEDYLFLSNIYLKQGRYQEAADAALKAVERTIVKKNFEKDFMFDFSNLLVKNPNEFNKAAYGFFKAIVHYESEENIIAFADQLDPSFFSLQIYFSGDASKSEVSSRHHDFCDDLLQYIFKHKLENKYPNLTSYYISTSKSLSLFEKLSTKKGVPDDLKTEYNELNEEWNEVYSELEIQEALGNVEKIDSLSAKNFQLNLRKEKLDEKLSSLNLVPDFRSLRHSLVSHAQSNLKSEEAIIDIFYGKEFVYAWYVDGDQNEFISKKIHPILEEDFIPVFSSTEMQYLQVYDKKLESISNYFKPFFKKIDNKISTLKIIPDGKLLYFPFEVLNINDRPLIDQVSIHYLFSYSISEFQRIEKQSKFESPYAGFAMKYDEAILLDLFQSEEIFKIYKDSFNLSQLPFAIEEINQAKEIFNGSSFLNDNCTRAFFFDEATKHQILHLANHALLNDENSYLSSIIFTQDGRADMINTIDIKKLDLNADLTILSSCNSGRGELLKGSGLRSLGLSFVEAGCPAILVNLWEASDKSTKQIIEAFSKYLKKGLSKSLALQKAKQDYITSVPRELQHPKYWASLVLVGDDAPLEFVSDSNNNWWIYLVLIVVLFIAGMIGKKWLNDSKT